MAEEIMNALVRIDGIRIATASQGVAVSRRAGFFLGLLGWALATGGRTDEARTILDELRTRPATASSVVSEGWLPGFDPLRADPRFTALLERLAVA